MYELHNWPICRARSRFLGEEKKSYLSRLFELILETERERERERGHWLWIITHMCVIQRRWSLFSFFSINIKARFIILSALPRMRYKRISRPPTNNVATSTSAESKGIRFFTRRRKSRDRPPGEKSRKQCCSILVIALTTFFAGRFISALSSPY